MSVIGFITARGILHVGDTLYGMLVNEAKKRGMTIWILDDKHFPTGYANGLISKYPERRKWHLVHRHVDVIDPQQGALVLEHVGENHTADQRKLVAARAPSPIKRPTNKPSAI